MLVFVDYEHADGHDRPTGPALLAARTTITYRLEDLAGMPCHLVRYDRISRELLDTIGARAMFISGNSFDPGHYDPGALAPIHDLIRTAALPTFGLCGGFQLMAEAFDAPIVPLEPSVVGNSPLTVETDAGRPFEFGYHPVELAAETSTHPLLEGIGSRPVFRHAHGLHVPEPPSGFKVLASTEVTPVQLAVDDDRRFVGAQFHPEYWTDEHPAGRALITNFLIWSGVTSRVH